MTGSLFESKNHLSQHNIGLKLSPTVMIGFFHHFNENIGLKSMSNIMMSLKDVQSLYKDDHLDEIGPAPAGPAE